MHKLIGLLACAAVSWPTSGQAEPAIKASVAYTGEVVRNTSGGLDVGSAYLDNLDLTLSVDGDRAIGVPGLTIFVYGLYNNGTRFSERYSGDVMGASNIDAPRAMRLYEAWVDFAFRRGRPASLRFGLYDLNSEFDTSDARALFVNSSFGVGHDLAQSGLHGPSIFPVTSLALRFALQPHEDWTLLTAVLDGVPGDPDDPAATTVRLHRDDGALLITEVQRAGARWTKLAIGGWRYTKDAARMDDDVLGVDPPRWSTSQGLYAMGDFELWRDSASSRQAVSSFARAGYASGSVHEYDLNVQAGLTWRQPWAEVSEESLGIAVSYARTGSEYRAAREARGSPLDSGELAGELTYRRAVTSWLTLQPTVQYIRSPSAERVLGDAFLLGLRLELDVNRTF